MFVVALFTIAKIRKQPKRLLIGEWIKKEMVCTHTHIHSTHTLTECPASKLRTAFFIVKDDSKTALFTFKKIL